MLQQPRESESLSEEVFHLEKQELGSKNRQKEGFKLYYMIASTLTAWLLLL